MRPEKAIRTHLDNLRWAQKEPCGCSGVHAQQCRSGFLMMEAVIKTLEWALGDNDDIGNQVERIAQDRAKGD